MNEIDQEELLYNKIYEQTKDFGRTHFIKEIMRLNRENTELKEKKQRLKDRINKSIEFIEKNGEKQYNQHDNYRGKWYSPDELQTIDKILKGE